MESGETRPAEGKRRRRSCCLCGLAITLLLLSVLAVVVALVLRSETAGVKATFTARCEQFKGYDCKKIWGAFEQAYVGRDPCEVSTEAYDPLISAAPFEPVCDKMMFWSKTKDVVHDFTGKRDCFVTLEDTLLGHVLNGLTWCGKEGSSETFTTDCPGWSDCENNTVRSFWNRASAAFADVACGNVTAMLNGSITAPFSPLSIFGSIEVKRFNSTRMRGLNVVLVTQENFVTNCTNGSLKDLQKELDKGIKYNCQEVPEAQIHKCSSDQETPCRECW